jgi:hypothetical protein
MKKTLVIAGALLALTAGMASASGLNLYWNDCSPGAGGSGVQSIAHSCTSNSGAHILVASLVAPSGIDACVAAESVVDIQTAAASLSPWWQFYTGGCRSAAMSVSYGFGALSSCLDPWSGAALGIAQVDPSPPALNRERLRTVAAVAEASAIPMTEGAEYYMFEVVISKQKTVGTGSCAGCLDNGSFVFNSCKITQPSGDPNGDPTISNPDQNQCASLGPINTADCLATPTRNATWGAIKAIYR